MQLHQRLAGTRPWQPRPATRQALSKQPRRPQQLNRAAPQKNEGTPLYTWTTTVAQTPPKRESAVVFRHQEVVLQLEQVQQQGEVPSAAWLQSLYSAPLQQLPASSLAELTALLEGLGQSGCSLDGAWVQRLLQHCSQSIAGGSSSSSSSTRQLAAFVWALSECDCELDSAALQPVAASVVAQLQDFFAPDLSKALSALGSLGVQLGLEQKQQLLEEVTFQLRSFMADFAPLDLARLISGVADLGLQPDEEFRSWLMKAVYTHSRTIEDRGAVDFALAKLQASDRSMLYDPRWTHEELSWLPRRERDKRRILKEGWYKTKWAGWAPGGRA